MAGRLTEDDLRRFGRDGYLVLPGLVPDELLAAADAEIDDLVEHVPPSHDGAGADATFWFLPPARLPRCHGLFADPASGVAATAAELVGPGGVEVAFDHVQVALTVPPWSHVPGAPHIDGHAPGADRVDSFTMLAGVALTDQSRSASGNLWVWPGSHLHHQELFRSRGTRALLDSGGHTFPGPGTELHLARGDVLLAHYLLGHNKGGNTSDAVRRTVYFRLQAPGHRDRWESTFLDAWHEYPPVERALRSADHERGLHP